jgi:hypothetical protein
VHLSEQTFRIASIGVGAVLGIGVVFLLFTASGFPDLPPTAIIIGVAVALVVAIGATVVGLAIGRHMVGDRIEVAMREEGGKWRHGRITVTPGHLSFEPYFWQVRIPHRSPVEIDVDRLSEDTGRHPPWNQMWSINPQLHIVEVASSEQVRELAALPSHVKELRERLSGQEQMGGELVV